MTDGKIISVADYKNGKTFTDRAAYAKAIEKAAKFKSDIIAEHGKGGLYRVEEMYKCKSYADKKKLLFQWISTDSIGSKMANKLFDIIAQDEFYY